MNGIKGFTNRFIKKQPKASKIKMTKDNSFLVFPFDLVAGFITSTENGIKDNDNTKITDYSTFQRVFTGLENLIAKWDNAYKVEKKNDTDLFLTKTYQPGRSIRAFAPSENLSASFDFSTISSDFLTEFTDESVKIHIYEDITEDDLFKLYLVPELGTTKWFYISDAVKYFNINKTLDHIVITLTTLNNKVAKSGMSIESFIQRGAPGEGYAWPLIDANGVVSIDPIRAKDVPITSMQIEMAGAAAFNTIAAYGRPVKTKIVDGVEQTIFNPEIEAPRLLLPVRIETAIPSAENTRPSAETDYYIGNFKPALDTEYKNWREQFTNSYDLSARNEYEGVLIGGTMADLRASNPVAANGTHAHTLWDSKFFYNIANKTYNTSADRYTPDSITLNGDYDIPQLFSHNFFTHSYITTLPLSVQQNVAWNLLSVPFIGGFLNKMFQGVDIGWNNKSIRLGMPDVNLIMPSSLAEYGAVLKGDGSTSTDVWIPLETFTGERADEATDYSGINATGTIFKIQFTDRFEKTINGVKYIFNTRDKGQNMPSIDDDGTTIPNPSGKLEWTADCKPVLSKVPGYVIDMPHFKALAKLDYRLTFFSNDVQVQTATYQTKSKFTGSIRDWTNTIKMSDWNEDNNKVISYPEFIVAPKPPGVNYPEVNIVSGITYDLKPVPPNYAPAYKQYIETIGASPFQNFGETTHKTIIPIQDTRIPLSQFGTISELKANYKDLKLVFSHRGQVLRNAITKVDLTNLFNTKGVNFVIDSFGLYGLQYIAYVDGRRSTQGGVFDINTTSKFELLIGEKLNLTLETQGNELVISGNMEITWHRENGYRTFEEQFYVNKKFEVKTITLNDMDWNNPMFEIAAIIAEPKKI